MKNNFSPAYLVCLALFAANRLLEAAGYRFPVLASYLDDLLILPLILYPALLIQRRFVLQNPAFRFSPRLVILTWLYFSLAFEGIIPLFHRGFTADWLDVAAYGTGGAYFYFLLNKKVVPPAAGRLT